MSALKIGDAVVYLASPDLFGIGEYVDTTCNGLMVVKFADGTRELFKPEELDTADRAYLSTP